MPQFVFTDGAIRFAEAARAVADASRELGSFREVRAVTAEAVQRRRCRLAQLTEELAHAPVRQSAWLRRALAEVADGVRSAAEGDLRSLLLAAGLPLPMFNARLYTGPDLLAVPDAWWPDAGVAVEVESREWHLSPEDWEATLRRSRQMSAMGIIMVHVTPQQIRTEPERIVADIRSALRSRAGPAGASHTDPARGGLAAAAAAAPHRGRPHRSRPNRQPRQPPRQPRSAALLRGNSRRGLAAEARLHPLHDLDVDAPGVKILATPSRSISATSASGTMPPPKTTTRRPRVRPATPGPG